MKAFACLCAASMFFVLMVATPPHQWWSDAVLALDAAGFGFLAGQQLERVRRRRP